MCITSSTLFLVNLAYVLDLLEHYSYYMHYLSAEVVTCSSLAIPTNGQRSSSRRNYNDRVSFSCITGYNLRGSSSRTCLSTGQWSGTQPTCNSKWRVHYWCVITVACMDAYFDPQQSTAFISRNIKKCIAYCHMLCNCFYTEMLFDHVASDQATHTYYCATIITVKCGLFAKVWSLQLLLLHLLKHGKL